jgi:uncharacterized protein (TIGR02611 family)
VFVAGVGLILLGFILIPLPGPGWAVVFAGLAVLATEFTWAEWLLHRAKRHASSATGLALRRVTGLRRFTFLQRFVDRHRVIEVLEEDEVEAVAEIEDQQDVA